MAKIHLQNCRGNELSRPWNYKTCIYAFSKMSWMGGVEKRTEKESRSEWKL